MHPQCHHTNRQDILKKFDGGKLRNQDDLKMKKPSFKRMCPAQAYTTFVVLVFYWTTMDKLEFTGCLLLEKRDHPKKDDNLEKCVFEVCRTSMTLSAVAGKEDK